MQWVSLSSTARMLELEVGLHHIAGQGVEWCTASCRHQLAGSAAAVEWSCTALHFSCSASALLQQSGRGWRLLQLEQSAALEGAHPRRPTTSNRSQTPQMPNRSQTSKASTLPKVCRHPSKSQRNQGLKNCSVCRVIAEIKLSTFNISFYIPWHL